MTKQNLQTNKAMFKEIKSLIELSKQNIAVQVNSSMTMLYWHIGKRINQEVLQDKRAEYGQQVVATLSRQLSDEYGKGWGGTAVKTLYSFCGCLS